MILIRYLIFPGLLFTAVLGLLVTWVDRKLAARLQWRVGPPWYQPFADFAKLMGKETIVPEGANVWFLLAPLIGLAGVTLASTILWSATLAAEGGFIGDVVVVFYLLVVPTLAVVLGGMGSGNPLSAVGASREIKLMLAYELPFLVVVLIPLFQAETLSFKPLLLYQAREGVTASALSGVLAMIVALLATQAKLSFVPFDIPEAECEIAEGPYLEYGGLLLGLFKVTRAMMMVALPLFLIALFWGGIGWRGWGLILSLLKYLVIIVVYVIIKQTNPRLRIDQAMKFFWGPLTGVAVAAAILAAMGW